MKKGIILVLSAVSGVIIGAGIMKKKADKLAKKIQAMSDKHLALFLMMNQWVKIKQKGESLSTYFEKKGYKKIAIYGMSYAGETLIEELRNSGIKVAYGIDMNADKLYSDVNLVTIEDDLENVDAVIVTAITFFDEIEKALSTKISCPIISLEDILYEIY